MYEVYLNSKNDSLVVEDLNNNSTTLLSEMPFDFLQKAENTIKTQYPETYRLLVEIHGDKSVFIHARVRHFFVCNFSVKDGRVDIDDDWNFNLENVPCPARIAGICKNQICSPKMTNVLTEREREVLRLFVRAFGEEEIAEALFISKSTVHNHINNMYQKIGAVGSTAPDRKLMNYAYSKKIV